jgi:molecular chaperone HscB
MTYFELYQEPFNLHINTSSIKRKYYALSREHHPDKFSLSDANAQEKAMKMSTEINEGLRVLSDFDLRLHYVLQITQHIIENEEYKLSPNFLMDMMDVNEEIEDAKANGDANALDKVQQKLNGLFADLKNYVNWNNANINFEDVTEIEFGLIKQYYYESKYLKRLQNLLQDKEVEM